VVLDSNARFGKKPIEKKKSSDEKVEEVEMRIIQRKQLKVNTK